MGVDVRSDFETGLAPVPGRHAAQRTGEKGSAARRASPGTGQRAIASKQGSGKGLAWPVLLFLVAQVMPWNFRVGPLSLPTPRIVLLAMVLPCLVQLMTGRAGRIRAADIAILLFCFWCALSLVV